MAQDRVSFNGSAEITTGGSKNCSYPVVSGDGTVLSFTTTASSTPGGANPASANQIWVRDVSTGATQLVSGKDTDPVTGERIDPPNRGSARAMVSGNGPFVVLESTAQSFPGDTSGGFDDVWIYDVDTFALERMSENPTTGAAGNGRSYDKPAISEFGRYVAFTTRAVNLVDVDPTIDGACAGARPQGGEDNVVILDRGESSLPVGGTPQNPSHIEWVSVGIIPIFDLTTGEPIGVADCEQPDGPSIEPSLSLGGCKVAYLSQATNLTLEAVPQPNPDRPIFQVYVYTRATGKNELVSQSTGGVVANGDCSNAQISGDGRFVVFLSEATELVGDDDNDVNDVFVRDLENDETTRISVASSGFEWSAASGFNQFNGFRFPGISPNGRFVTFGGRVDPDFPTVDNTTILPRPNVIIHDRDADDDGDFDELTAGTFEVEILSYVPNSNPRQLPNDNTGAPLWFTGDSKYLFFESNASDLDTMPPDTNGPGLQGRDIFKREVWQ